MECLKNIYNFFAALGSFPQTGKLTNSLKKNSSARKSSFTEDKEDGGWTAV